MFCMSSELMLEFHCRITFMQRFCEKVLDVVTLVRICDFRCSFACRICRYVFFSLIFLVVA